MHAWTKRLNLGEDVMLWLALAFGAASRLEDVGKHSAATSTNLHTIHKTLAVAPGCILQPSLILL